MKTEFYNDGASVRVLSLGEGALTPTLPPGLYTVHEAPGIGLHLRINENKIKLPEKVYGNSEELAERIIKTYEDRDVSTGVLLTGEKGSGKTMLTTLIAMKMLAKSVPIVQVSSAFRGPTFIEFINQLGNVVLIFDEYAKVYGSARLDEAHPDSTILTLLDGTNKQKRLAILIENSVWRVSEYLINRPGRLYYHFKYNKLGKDVLEEYCQSQNLPEKVFKDIMKIRNGMRVFNFDMLKAIVEEYKRYNLSVVEIVKSLNIEIREADIVDYKILKFIRNKDDKALKPEIDTINTSEEGSYFNVFFTEKGKARNYTQFLENHIRTEEGKTKVLDNGEYTLVLEEIPPTVRDYSSYL